MTFTQLKKIAAKKGITLTATGRFANTRYHMQRPGDIIVVTYDRNELAELETAVLGKPEETT